MAPIAPRAAPTRALEKTPTPGKSTCEDVAALLGLPLSRTVKSLVLATDELDAEGDASKATLWLLLRARRSFAERGQGRQAAGLDRGFRFATAAEIDRPSAASPATSGRSAPTQPVHVVADRAVAAMSDFVCGANEADFHYTGVNWGRDLPEPELVADIRNAVAGDPSPDGKGVLAIQRGIEVGHVFLLGTSTTARR